MSTIRGRDQSLNTLNIPHDEFTRCVKTLERNVHHITQLVDDLLDISRITQGAIRIRKQRLELATVIEVTVESLQSMIDAKKQTLHLDLPVGPVFIHGDPVRLSQILFNLLNNSVKYTGEGGRIELTAEVNGPAVAIRVKDNGMGITAELLPKIFDLFTQSKRGLSRSDGGLGIGLALVKQLVGLHGGEITAQSKGHDQGSEFTIHLPLCFEKDMPVQLSSFQAGSDDAVGSLRILLIDDNIDVTASLALWLEQEGHQIKSAVNGAEGIDMAESFKPEIVILDIGLPDMDGYDLARRLRSLPSGSKMSLIAMSGYAPHAKLLKESQCNINHYLIKPPQKDQLRKLIADHQKTK